jgi:flagellar protein FliS
VLDQYRRMSIETASPEELVVRMYEGAIRQARVAREAHLAAKLGERGKALSRALAIVGELRGALDLERGGEIARNLRGLYGFVWDRLLEANLSGRVEAIDEAVDVLERLLGAWQEIASRPKAKAASG